MRRREFIKAVVLSATAWPLAARAQQSTMPIVGFIGITNPEDYAFRLAAFRQGLRDAGFIEGQNVKVEYRWANDQPKLLPEAVAGFVQRNVALIVAGGGTPAAIAAKSATATIPIVFAVAIDPVKAGFVTSLNKPGGNLTGVTNLNVEITAKRLELVRELIPKATTVGLLVNPKNPAVSGPFLKESQATADILGIHVRVLEASTASDIETVFARIAQSSVDALILMPDNFLSSRIKQLAALSLGQRVPAIFHYRAFAAAGGLVSYGSDETEYYRQVGLQAGKILNGEKPADLPVVQSTKVQLVINLKTAKALGVTVPLPLLGRADEVIE
jgi:ABC-type uncharacterized transport system substrate-binding protein